jgi:trehalose-6-phosphate synthase
MILSETSGAAELLSESVSTVGYTDIAAMADAMGAAIEESTSTRRIKGDQIRTIVSEINSSAAILRVLIELEKASQSR